MRGMILTRFAAVALAIVFCMGLYGCGDNNSPIDTEDTVTSAVTDISYEGIDVFAYISGVTYKGVKYTLDSGELSQEQVMWDAMLRNASVLSYPEDKVDYYFNQIKATYLYLADGDAEAYEMLLESRGMDENKMRREAMAMVKKDLVLLYIVASEGIAVTEAEKQEHFEKYVSKYVSDYGYDREYVVENMKDEIYESMLYDKTVEYLFTVNTFEYVEVSDTAANQG